MKTYLKITETVGKISEIDLHFDSTYSIGRAKDSDVGLNDRRVLRKHAHIRSDVEKFTLIDGVFENGKLKRSVNKVFINDEAVLEKILQSGDQITIGTSKLEFGLVNKLKSVIKENKLSPNLPPSFTEMPKNVQSDDKPSGNTQMFISANEIIGKKFKNFDR